MEIRAIHQIKTADNVRIQVELAGLASRVFAYGIDSGMIALLSGLTIGASYALASLRTSPELVKTIIPLELFIISFGYHIFQEWLWNGKTLGKSFLKLRVVRNNGQPIGFWESLGRNLLRVLDVYLAGIGFICMMCSKREKRFGDYLAGTVVVHDQPVLRPAWMPEPTIDRAVSPNSDNLPMPKPLAPVFPMTEEEVELLRSFQSRRQSFQPAARKTLAQSLCTYFEKRWHRAVSTEADLDEGLASYQVSLTQAH